MLACQWKTRSLAAVLVRRPHRAIPPRSSPSCISTSRTLSLVAKEPLAPLGKHLLDTIKISGPISVAQYMRQALTHPHGGYYMRGDVFGPHGDFTTSPEVSQMFGEMLAIWFITQYQSHRSPSDVQLIEFGPGRGTLMADMIRTFTQFPSLRASLKTIHLIEASPGLRHHQARLLAPHTTPTCDELGTPLSVTGPTGVDIRWHASLDGIPRDTWSMIIAHEFLDAMPIYKFQLTPLGWREILVDIDDSQSSPYNFRFTLSPAATRASVTLLSHPQFHPAPAPAPAPESDAASSHVYKVGDRVEVAPDAWGVARSISERVAGSPPSGKHNQSDPSPGGVALIVDYGNDWTEGDSLR
ncbi:hypothetical protein SeMB42_g07595, partial [Synchytrium endobioticum]